MKTTRQLSLVPLLAGLALAACQDGDPAGPSVETLALEDQLALELLQDPSTIETALEVVGIQATAAYRRGHAWGQSQDFSHQARFAFQNAQAALGQGDQLRAMARAREARRLLAHAMEAADPNALNALVEHLESLPLAVEGEPEAFSNPGGLGMMLGQLGQEAGQALRKGDRIRAGQLGILGEQLFRQGQGGQGAGMGRNADLAVALGAEAIELATRLLDEAVATAEQAEQDDLLATALEFQAQAQTALEAGELARAAHLARLAQWWALKALVLPDGVTDEEVQSMLDLAASLLQDAREAVGAEPDSLQTLLLEKAARMLEAGAANMENGTCRGIGALWQVAVISSYLIG